MKDKAPGQAERRMKAVLKPQRTQRTQRGNTNQEAGCRAGRAAPAMQLHLYHGAEGGGGPPFGRKHISISQITASVALVLCSLRLRLAFPARRASLYTDNQTSDSASHSKQWPPSLSFAGILPTNQNIFNARPNARQRARYTAVPYTK